MSIETGSIPIEATTPVVGVEENPLVSEQQTVESRPVNIVIEPSRVPIGSYSHSPSADGLSEFIQMVFESADAIANVFHLGAAVTEQAGSSLINNFVPGTGQANPTGPAVGGGIR